MRLYPAVDILEGSAVRLVKGDFDAKKVYDADPTSAARTWVDAGARALHVVDLDGARAGEPVNLSHLSRIASELGVPVQYGGGLRTPQAVDDALAAGAGRVILGTAAFTDPGLLRTVLTAHGPDRLLVSIDVRGGHVATHGWLQTTEAKARDAFSSLHDLGVRNFVFTNIDHDGMLDGANREEAIWVARAAAGGNGGNGGAERGERAGAEGNERGSAGEVIYSGGIGALSDLELLAGLRVELGLHRMAGVIVGTALYEGRFTVAQAQAVLDRA
jgi:phosphoribosylformimino-5-aminoimidazole carboxamide ribotide isomerase